MYHYLRKMFFKPANLRELHRTVSGLDRQHLESGNYLYKNFKKTWLREMADSLSLLNIYGEGSLNRLARETKTQHLSCQKPSGPSVLSKANSLQLASQKNSFSPPKISFP